MVSLKIIATQELPNLSKLKGIAMGVLLMCALLFTGKKHNSILEKINDELLYIAVAIIAVACLITILVCFVIEQTKQQMQVGTAIFNEIAVQQASPKGGLYCPYKDVSKICIRRDYSISSSSLFLIELYSNDNPNYCFDDFICEASSLGTVRYLADYLRQQGVNCELSDI